jgi:hypothetical protein
MPDAEKKKEKEATVCCPLCGQDAPPDAAGGGPGEPPTPESVNQWLDSLDKCLGEHAEAAILRLHRFRMARHGGRWAELLAEGVISRDEADVLEQSTPPLSCRARCPFAPFAPVVPPAPKPIVHDGRYPRPQGDK